MTREELERRIAFSQQSLAAFIENPDKINELDIKERLDILDLLQHYYELVQALVRADHSEHSWEFMAAHADVNHWKNKLMDAKAILRLEISRREQGV